MPSAPFVSTAVTETLVQETDTTLPIAVTKDTGLTVPAQPGTTVGASTAAGSSGTSVSGVTVTPSPGGGLIIAGSTAAGTPAREHDVTDTSVTTKVTNTRTSVVTSPAGTNQYEHAPWNVPGGQSTTILFLQMLGVTATYMSLYRVTNDLGSQPVQVEMGQVTVTLQPGCSIDVSAQVVILNSLGGLPALGSYQNLCCAVVTQAVGQSKGGGAAAGAPADAAAPLIGGGLIQIDGGDGGPDFSQLIFPDDQGGGRRRILRSKEEEKHHGGKENQNQNPEE